MLKKVSSGLLATSVVVSAAVLPQAYAMSDEVAVQLLERLGELEKEVSGLRGENETLRHELKLIKSTQREGFLDVDERVSGLENDTRKESDDGDTIPGVTITTEPVTSSLPDIPTAIRQQPSESTTRSTLSETGLLDGKGSNGSNGPSQVIDSKAPETGEVSLATDGGAADADKIVIPQTPQTTQIPTPPVVEFRADDKAVDEAKETENVSAVVSNPEDRKAIAPVTEKVEKPSSKSDDVDPNSPESYYYYGLQEKNKSSASSGNKTGLVSDSRPEKPVPETSIPASHQAKAEYNEAYKLLVNKPEDAVSAFKRFLEKHPDHELAANAQYWLGEALYAEKDFSAASEEFMKVLKQYKSSPKAPGAALKLGYSFYELGQWDFARRTLEDTVRFFPKSNSAKLAQNRLQRMTAEGH